MEAATTTFLLTETQINSDEIIIAAFKTMNLKVFEDILDEDKKYEDTSKWLFLAKLRDKFNWFKRKGDTELIIKPGKCLFCNKGQSGFKLVGNNSGEWSSYLIVKDEKQTEILDLIDCTSFLEAGMRNPMDDF